MTREEQITFKAGSIADGCIAHGAPWKDYYQGFIEGAKWADANPSQPSLPSNLDEAAEETAKKYYCSCLEKHNETGICDGCENVKLTFKAGAEWMAGQGVSLSHLIAWYIQSVDAHEPVWTEEHLEELVKDYILIPKH